jgi:hypothetical protein
MASETSKTIQAVDTALEFIDSIATGDDLTTTDLVEMSGLSRSSVHHYLCSLEQAGYVTRENGELSLGERFLRLGGRYRQQLVWFPTVQQQALRLAHTVDSTVSIEILRENTVITIFVINDGTDARHPTMGFEQSSGESPAGQAFDIAGGDDRTLKLPTDMTVDGKVVVALEGQSETEASAPEATQDRVRIARAVCPTDEPLAAVSIWVPQEQWDETAEVIKEELNTAVGTMEVNVTYSEW